MSEVSNKEHLMDLMTEIVSSYVSGNEMAASAVPEFIESVYKTLERVQGVSPDPQERLEPAVAIEDSITPDYIVCLEDGKQLKMLKRHLKTAYGLTPEGYREKWGLPADYPMVAPNYAKQRSRLAKDIGLGKK